MKHLHLIWSNLKRRKLRSLLTVLSILVAFVLYGYLAAIETAFSAGVEVAGADRLVVRHKVSIIQLLPQSYKARIGRIPGVESATHFTWFGGVYQEPKNFFAQMPVEPVEFAALYPEYVIEPEAYERWLKTRTGAIVGRHTAERFGWKVGDRIPLQATIWPREGSSDTWEFEIVGIYDGAEKATDTTGMYFRYDYFDESRAFGEGLVGWYVVKVSDPDQAEAVAAAIDEEFANSPAETKAEPEKAFMQSFVKQIGNIGLIMTSILAAVFFTILLISGNTMSQSVRERAEEIGVLKALGFTNRAVLGMVLFESCLLAFLGGGIGLLLAWLSTAGGDPTGGYLPVFYIPAADLGWGGVYVLLLGILAGAFPAIQAMRLPIADALRRA